MSTCLRSGINSQLRVLLRHSIKVVCDSNILNLVIAANRNALLRTIDNAQSSLKGIKSKDISKKNSL